MKLVVLPSEMLREYEEKGLKNLDKYYNPDNFFDEVYVVSPIETLSANSYGLKVIPVKSTKEFKSIVKKISPDFVRAYGGYWASTYAILNTPPTIPVLVSIHDTDPILTRSIIKYADSVICMTEAVKCKVLEKGVDVDNVSLLPNRLDLDSFKNCEINKITEFGRFILHVGRRTEQKNLETVIASLAHLPAAINLVTIGIGPQDRYISLAKELGVLSRVKFLNSVPNNELVRFYKSAEAFVLPTRWEGFGIVFIEAAAAGCPIIGSNIAPINELFTNNVDSLLVNPEDHLALANAVNKVLEDNELSQFITTNASKMIEVFDRKEVDKREILIYRNTISTRRRESSINMKFTFLKDMLIVLFLKSIRKVNHIAKYKKWK